MGNSCTTFTEVISDLPVDASPPIVVPAHAVGKVLSYDPLIGTGDAAYTGYIGGKCKFATFDKTGATVFFSFTDHFVVTNGGNRVDRVVTTLQDPAGGIGDFSLSWTELRQ